jgi:two-component system sensor histidine kinase YesM
MLKIFSGGYTMEGIANLKWQLSPGTAELVGKLTETLTSKEAVNLSKRQAQFLAMQNQINPHFLYNTLEGIRGEAIAIGADSIALMTETLSEFFRYTISNLENLVTLSDELSNVRNYYTIQQYRFGDRLDMKIEFDSDADRNLLMNAKVPKLILQPIVENAIIHGVEKLQGQGIISIRVLCTEKRLLITVSDNGVGIEPEKLRKLNEQISNMHERFSRDAGGRGGIALANVNNRIKLLFGEAYGVNILSVPGVGTDTEFVLPYITRYSEIEFPNGAGPA